MTLKNPCLPLNNFFCLASPSLPLLSPPPLFSPSSPLLSPPPPCSSLSPSLPLPLPPPLSHSLSPSLCCHALWTLADVLLSLTLPCVCVVWCCGCVWVWR